MERWIEGLGSDDFLVRQQASERLLQSGADAVEKLRAAKDTPDEEVRYRIGELLKEIHQRDLKQRIDRFLDLPPDSRDDCGFKNWPTFARFTGTTREARSLLVAINGHLSAAGELTSASDRPLPMGTRFSHRSARASVNTYAAEMFRRLTLPAAMRAAGAVSPQLVGDGVVEELSASAFEANFLSLPRRKVWQNEHREPFIALLTAWLKQQLQTGPLTLGRIKIIYEYRLSAFSDRLISALGRPQYPHKSAVLEALSKISLPLVKDDPVEPDDRVGVDDAINQLLPYVFSQEVLIRLPQAEVNGPADITLGDVAFQIILQLEEKQPKDFGMLEAGGKMTLSNSPVFCYKSRAAADRSINVWLAEFRSASSGKD